MFILRLPSLLSIDLLGLAVIGFGFGFGGGFEADRPSFFATSVKPFRYTVTVLTTPPS